MSALQDAALLYARNRMSIIPIGSDKKPLIPWAEFQTRRASEEEIKTWFEKFPNMQIGMVCGKISGISVVDVEKGGAHDFLPPTLCQTTGGGGIHYLYTHVEGVKNGTRLRDLLDIRGEGGFIVVAPSVSSKGPYEWVDKTVIPTPFPVHLFPQKALSAADRSAEWQQTMGGVSSGNRNDTAASVCGKLMRGQHPNDWQTIVWPALSAWNQKNVPPLDEKELRLVYESVAKKAVHDPPPRVPAIPVTADTVDAKIGSVSWDEALDMGVKELDATNSEDCISFGYDFLDDRLTGLFPGEMAVIGSATGGGKTTLTMRMATKAAGHGHRVFVFALEDRLPDYAMKALFYRLNMNAKKAKTRAYKWNLFRRNAYRDDLYRSDIARAREDIKCGNLFFAKVNERITFSALAAKIRQERAKGTELFLLDHLHMMNLDEHDASRAINIENFLNDLKMLIIEIAARVVLVVQYAKIKGEMPSQESFKDANAISHIANYVVHLWRERDVKAGRDQSGALEKFRAARESPTIPTWFLMSKVRNPNGEQACVIQFDRETGDYLDQKADEPRPMSDMVAPAPKAEEFDPQVDW